MIYLDANVIIRLIEGTAAARTALDARLASTRGTARAWATSRLTRLECRTLLDRYEQFLTGREVVVLEVDAVVIERATELRARLNVRTPDAIHLASAVIAGASAFLTGDKDLARCTDVAVDVM